MNGRQAARAAAERIRENERILALNKADIVAYNLCILHMIDHGSPCDFCEDLEECRKEEKDVTIGCDNWMLKMQRTEGQDESKGVLSDGSQSGTEAENPESQDPAL